MLDPVDPLRGLLSDVIDALAQPDYRPVKTYHEGKPVYVSQPEQEPVEDVVAYHSDGTRTVRIAPKRPWVGLTEEEASWCQAPSTIQTWKRIEAKLKEKNT